jgi:hypothetical protein
LESLGYLLIYFLSGELPWQGLQAKTKQEKYEKISHKKANTPVEILCLGFPSTPLPVCLPVIGTAALMPGVAL